MAYKKGSVFEAVYKEKMTGDSSGVDALIQQHQQEGRKKRAENAQTVSTSGGVPPYDRTEAGIAADRKNDILRTAYEGQGRKTLFPSVPAKKETKPSYSEAQSKLDKAKKIAQQIETWNGSKFGVDAMDKVYDDQIKALLSENGYQSYDDLQNAIDSLGKEAYRLKNEERYGNLEKNADFAEKSQAVPGKITSGIGIALGTSWLGAGDAKFDYINDIDGYRKKFAGADKQGNSPYAIYDYMEPGEVARYNYIHNTQGEKAANEYLDYLKYDLDARKTQDVAAGYGQYATEHPVAASAASVPANLMGGIGYLSAAGQYVGNKFREGLTGEYRPVNYNTWAMYPTIAATTIRGTVSENIADSTGRIQLDEGKHPILSRILNGKSLGDVYQMGMSMADSTAVALLTPVIGNGGLALLGGSAATQGMMDALDRGATDGQAITMGMLNGAFETIFEKVSLENLLQNYSKTTIQAIFSQMLAEGSEEFNTTLANDAADLLVMAGKSDYRQNIEKYRQQGLDEETATKYALWDKAVSLAWDAIGGAVSGGIMGAVSAPVERRFQNIRTSGDTQVQQEAVQAEPAKTQEQQTNEAIQKALNMNKAEESAAPQGNALDEALAKFSETGKVSNNTAEKVLGDPEAVRQLIEKTGAELGYTASQKRNAVKQAIADIFSGTNKTEQNATEQAPAQETVYRDEAVPQAAEKSMGENQADNQNAQMYNENKNIQGGNNNAGTAGTAVTAPAGAELHGTAGEGVRAVQSGAEPYSRSSEYGVYGQGHLRGSGELLLSDSAQKALADRGSPNVPMDSCTDAQAFKNALDDGRNSDVKNGWCVSPKELSDLTEPGAKMYLARNGEAGFVIKGGDIEAVFTNKAKGAPKGLADSLMLRALSAGGNKLDCYGEVLATLYSKYGFEPVARVAFNQEYANTGWDPSKGEPYIYVMKHNGDSVDTVAGKLGTYQSATKAQLDDLPTFGKNDYDKAMAYRDSLMSKARPQTADTSKMSANGGQYSTGAGDTLGQQNAPSGDVGQSKTVTNTGLRSTDEDIRKGYEATIAEEPDAASYDVKHNADTMGTAKERTETPEKVQAEYEYLMNKDAWTAEDLTTAKLITKNLMKNGGDGAQSQITEMNLKIRDIGRNAGQVTQAFSIIGTMADSGDSVTAAQYATNAIFDMEQDESIFKSKDGQFYKQWQKSIAGNITRIGMEIEQVQDGDIAGMLDIVRQIARFRKTTAWFGKSQNLTKTAERILGKLSFEDLKTVATTQISAIPDNFRARTKSEVIQGIRKQSMLASLKTFARNIAGNTFGGLMDSASDSTSGRMADAILSKFTGKRTVGNDFKNAKAYMNGAKEAAQFASLCVELDIPIETDAISSFESATGDGKGYKYIGKTFRPNGNVAMRAMYAFQKYMSYSLEVSDKIFEGGTNAAVSESLNGLKGMSLTDEEMSDLSQFAANRRTFKDATWKGENGETRGATLSRIAESAKNIGKGKGVGGEIVDTAIDFAVPFAKVPMNVAQMGIDYTTGIAKGAVEIASIIKDARDGKEINAVRQRNAVTDFGRGVTGVGMIATFAAAAAMGAIKVTNPKDKDEKALAQSEGRSGAQINWNAMARGLSGGSEKWQDGDVLTSLDFLEPFNTQLYLGYELAQGDSVLDALKAYPGATIKSVLNAFMDSPMMSGLAELFDTIQEVADAETDGERADAVAGYVGDAVSSFIPQIVRQTAQETDGYYRDTRGNNSVEYAVNNILAGIPGLSQTLPKKYNGLGEPQKRGGILETFVDPTATKTYNQNEVTAYLDDLKEKTGDVSIYPDRQAPMSIRVDGESVALDGTARETYQKTYGDLVNSYYTNLMNSQAFRGLPEEVQAEALNKANSYAKEHAKAAVSEYQTDKPKAAGTVTDEIITSVVQAQFSGAFDSMEPSELDSAYSLYKALPFSKRENFKRATGGRTEYFITAKESGVSTKAFASLYSAYKSLDNNTSMEIKEKAQEWSAALEKAYDSGQITKAGRDALKDEMKFYYQTPANTAKFDAMTESGMSAYDADRILKGLNALSGTGSIDKDTGKKTVTDADKWGYISGVDGISDSERDMLMKLYMPHYDPTAKNPVKTELKYDYLRDQGYSAEEYVETYRVTQQYSKKAERINAWKALGYSDAEARMLYKLYKGKIDLTG